jgi:Tol biopolymer transport system component
VFTHTACAGLIALLVSQTPHGVMHHFPRWSPDGAHVLASSTSDGDSEIYLFPVGGGSPRKLTDNATADDAARWSRDGRRIFFMSDRRGRFEPFVMNADGTGQAPFDGPEETPTSPDGSRILEIAVDGRGALVAVEKNGARRTLTKGFHAEQGSYSPDGRLIVYEQRSTADEHDVLQSNIIIARADGSDPRVLSMGTDPSWSPDGTFVLFKAWDAADRQLWIAVVSRDGMVRRLAPGVHPDWSPDGRRIAFMHDQAGRTDIWIMNRDGGNRSCLTCPRTPLPQKSGALPSPIESCEKLQEPL